MKLRYLKTAFVLIATSLLFACSEFDDVEVRVNLKSGGTPVANAEVIIDGTVKGVTDASGHFMTVLQQKENTAFEVSVKKDENGVRLENWIQLTSYNDQTDDEFEYNLDLKSIPYVFISVKDGEEPVIDATLRNGKDILGVTDKRGNIYFDLNTTDKKNYTISMSKLGYGTWKANKALAPGDKVDVMLDRLMMVNVQVNTESYGDSVPVNGVDVFLGNQKIGTTNAKGVVRYSQNGQRKGKGTLTLKSAKYAPGVWKTQVPLIGDVAVKRYVYPRKANPLRVGFYRFSANTDGEDIGTIPARFQAEIIKEISGQDGFTVVDTDKLVAAIKQSKISMQKLKKDGWKNTDLHKLVDTIVFGSVSKNIKGAFIVEANFHNYEGGVAAREIALAKSSGRLDRAARELVINLKEHYPFEGLVYEQEGESYTINLGSSQFPVNRKDEFAVYNPVTSKSGKIEKYKEVGTLKINRTHNDNSSAEVNTLVKKGTKVDIGARVVRRPDREGDGKEFVTVAAKGMVDGQVKPLSGVNIYLDQKWVATTDQRGKARVNLRLKKEYDLSLYRQGYSQVDKEDFEVKDNAALVEFDLESYVSKLTVASNPAGAVIFLDDEKIGTTPMENKTVPTGFHSLKISAGGEYRDFEEVIEFTNEPKDFSGEKTVT
ncbi:MAG: PEGA domain-containing protein, partial [Gammaproteobacteria bacterium]|nr:PEGA domain-containing protein [Gammaproteobacteria bacterium]